MEDAVELLEKRSNNYSDRPYIPMVNLYVQLWMQQNVPTSFGISESVGLSLQHSSHMVTIGTNTAVYFNKHSDPVHLSSIDLSRPRK